MSIPIGPFMSHREMQVDVWKNIGPIIMGMGAVCGILLDYNKRAHSLMITNRRNKNTMNPDSMLQFQRRWNSRLSENVQFQNKNLVQFWRIILTKRYREEKMKVSMSVSSRI